MQLEFNHTSTPPVLAPSVVLRVRPSEGHVQETLLAHDGMLLSAISVAAPYHLPSGAVKYIAGAITDHGILVCDT